MEEEGVMVIGRAIIDTRPPFRSVKEAVAMFGEKVLVGEIYAKQFKDKEIIQTNKVKPKKEEHRQGTQNKPLHVVVENVAIEEVEETKESLKKAKEEGENIVSCLKSLKKELEQTKKELGQLKTGKQAIVIIDDPINPEIEELKYVETNNNNNNNNNNDLEDGDHEIQKKKLVSFASPPFLTRDITNNKSRNNNNKNNKNNDVGVYYAKVGKTTSFGKEGKKKPVVPIVGWLFSNKKKEPC